MLEPVKLSTSDRRRSDGDFPYLEEQDIREAFALAASLAQGRGDGSRLRHVVRLLSTFRRLGRSPISRAPVDTLLNI